MRIAFGDLMYACVSSGVGTDSARLTIAYEERTFEETLEVNVVCAHIENKR